MNISNCTDESCRVADGNTFTSGKGLQIPAGTCRRLNGAGSKKHIKLYVDLGKYGQHPFQYQASVEDLLIISLDTDRKVRFSLVGPSEKQAAGGRAYLVNATGDACKVELTGGRRGDMKAVPAGRYVLLQEAKNGQSWVLQPCGGRAKSLCLKDHWSDLMILTPGADDGFDVARVRMLKGHGKGYTSGHFESPALV